jgi:glycosyltransferase involved in cell wall biosynthesis
MLRLGVDPPSGMRALPRWQSDDVHDHSATDRRPAWPGPRSIGSFFSVSFFASLREIYRRARFRYASLRGQSRQHLARLRPPLEKERRRGALFIGYAEGNLGLGQAFRNSLQAAQTVGLSFGIYPFRVGIETRMLSPFMQDRYDRTHPYDLNVIVVAADQMPNVLNSIDGRLLNNSYNVLQTFWELPRAPGAWRRMLRPIDELWVPNKFVAEAFRPLFLGPITLIPPAIHVGDGPFPSRDHFRMDPRRFYFMFSFDYYSSAHRKNPVAAIEAFRRAFPKGNENVGLIIKSNGNERGNPDVKASISQAAAADLRIVVIEKNMSRAEILGMIRASDAYVSLHRSEGFGMGIAEAMNFGRVVIATDFSGSTDFVTPQTGFPVKCTLQRVAFHEYPWSNEQVWAEPDINSAAAAMEMVWRLPDLARERARAGQKLVQQRYGVAAVGEMMKARITYLMNRGLKQFPQESPMIRVHDWCAAKH